MAITTYISETGGTQFKVYVNIRSKTNPKVRAQRKLKGIRTQREAERAETTLIRECEREILEQESQGQSWGAVVEAWKEHLNREHSSLAETTRMDYIASLNNHTGHWMSRQAAMITPMDVREVLNQLKAKGGTHEFLKRTKNMLGRVFTFGMETGMIKVMCRSPTFGVKLDRPAEKTPEILTGIEIRKLLAKAKVYRPEWYPIWAMAILTGMRNGELYSLLWSDIDWENHSLTVSKSFCSRFKVVKGTKAGYWRTVPISSELLSLLKEVKAQAGSRPEVLPRNREWHMGMQADELRKFCLGIKLTSVRFHTLRACFATQLIRNAVPPIQIQKICGWKDLKTMQRYIRMAGIEIEGATEALKVLPDMDLIKLPEPAPVTEPTEPQIAAHYSTCCEAWRS